MGHILIDKIRISGFRGLRDFEMPLCQTTVLTGMNNSGKTSILKALQLALGSRAFLEVDDFFSSSEMNAEKIIVDIRIVQIGDDGTHQDSFEEDWETIFKTDKIKVDDEFAYVPLRTTATYNSILSKFDIEQKILNNWLPADGVRWQDIVGKKQSFSAEEMPFFYIDAQRDVVEDMKLKNSYLGKMLADVAKGYNNGDIEALESLIAELNQQTIDKSTILSTIKTALEGINSAMDKKESGVELSPFAKKIRDLNRGVSIHYGEEQNSFTMDYHGMGTRSWSSLLTLKAFITHGSNLAADDSKPFFPIIAIEEPESHLHPNAQKKLYKQMAEMPGQKIISTHSPYIAASAELSEVRGIYRKTTSIFCGNIDTENLPDADDKRKLRQKVINTRGELFFSKAMVLFEGETEEQALPILAEKHFGCAPHELGIDFIGVGGAGQYFPFLCFANAFGIPWYIFSDGEDLPVRDMTNAVSKLRGTAFTTIYNESNVIILDNKDDFEKYIVGCDYIDDIKAHIKQIEIPKCSNEQHAQAKGSEIDKYTNEYILAQAKEKKTYWALIFANSIANSKKSLPPKVVTLFDKIKTDLSHE